MDDIIAARFRGMIDYLVHEDNIENVGRELTKAFLGCSYWANFNRDYEPRIEMTYQGHTYIYKL